MGHAESAELGWTHIPALQGLKCAYLSHCQSPRAGSIKPNPLNGPDLPFQGLWSLSQQEESIETSAPSAAQVLIDPPLSSPGLSPLIFVSRSPQLWDSYFSLSLNLLLLRLEATATLSGQILNASPWSEASEPPVFSPQENPAISGAVG